MPVSLWPIVFPLIVLLAPAIAWKSSRRTFRTVILLDIATVGCILTWHLLPGAVFLVMAKGGNGRAMYELARWHDNHNGYLANWCILWPAAPDQEAGYYWLQAAASDKVPIAMYALGVRLKYGYDVPKPEGWNGPRGNWFPQPKRGQELIDEALKLGYIPRCEEDIFYADSYR